MNAPTLHPDLVALKVHVDRLHSLLAAPEPGLMSWNETVRDDWQAVIELAAPPKPSSGPMSGKTHLHRAFIQHLSS